MKFDRYLLGSGALQWYIIEANKGCIMTRLLNKYKWLLFATIIVSVGGVVNLSKRPVPPFRYHQLPEGVRIDLPIQSSRSNSALKDHLVYKVDEIVVEDIRQISAILEGKSAGDSLQLVFVDGMSKRVYLPGAGYHWTLIIYMLLGLSFYVIAILVWQHASHTGEKYFGYAALLFGISIILNSTGLHLPLVLSIPITAVYFFCYLFAFIMFHYFSYFFPEKVLPAELLHMRKKYLIGGGIVLSVLLTISYFTKTFSPSFRNVVVHDYIYRGFRAIIVLLFATSLNILYQNLHFDPNPKNYRKVYWLIWGIIFGSAPFLLFWNVPQLFGYPPLLPEWLVTLCLIIIPVSIAISIIKYRLFDIEIILSRSIVYFAVIAILLAFYIFLVGGLSLVVYQQFSLQSPVFSLITAVGIGLIFNPLKVRVTNLIDRKFFRIRYDRFLALKKLLNTLENCYTQNMVLRALQEQYHSVVPLEHSFFATLKSNKWRFLPRLTENREKWFNALNYALLLTKKEIIVNESHKSLVEDLKGKIIHPLPDKGIVLVPVGSVVFWCLGKKLSDSRFWKEDIELVEQMAQAAAIQLEKVRYFQRSVEEAMEKERMQQLSRWKTLLVAAGCFLISGRFFERIKD